ncbi:MAG: KAP P-loop protein, partial [Nitrosomonadaceae bacterium]|nr:KAP P-loop protein [Nitrosomonadaceae bacterium]
EETEGRCGAFSLRRDFGGREFKNSERFQCLKSEVQVPAWFLLTQLFDAETLGIGDGSNVEESVLRSRACFNSGNFRNLEAYLKLIVRFATPEPQETFVLYQDAVERVHKGASIASLLTSVDFELTRGEHAHDQFWRVLVNRSHEFNIVAAEDAVETLVEYLPRYSAFDSEDRGLRQRSIYSLLRLLDRAGWGRASGRRLPNSAENVVEIAWRIFGEHAYRGRGLIERLASPDRGVLGWSDLMLFRLQCSADRQGQLYNVQTALIVDQDMTAATSGLVNKLALIGMRKLSQEVFALFKRAFIDSKRNFFAETDDEPVERFLGVAFAELIEEASQPAEYDQGDSAIGRRIASARSFVKSFVIYQLSNSLTPNGSGVGCGFYDEKGSKDGGGIAQVMNDYVFGVCFNPEINEDNILLFLDHCLSHLSSSFFSGRDEDGFVATRTELPGGLNPHLMGRYWRKYRDLIRGRDLHASGRCVFTPNYTALYRDYLGSVFDVLDELADALPEPDKESAT